MKTKLVLVALAGALSAYAATLTGEISDSACGPSHAKMLAQHKDMKTDHDCTLACVKGGSKYVLVSEGKVYSIANQDAKDLETQAGEMVKVSGNVKGDTITVSKISAVKK
jgi:hypothetical protein